VVLICRSDDGTVQTPIGLPLNGRNDGVTVKVISGSLLDGRSDRQTVNGRS
jgi:hypothetical protein